MEGAKGYTLSIATPVTDALAGTGTAAVIEECNFGGNCVDIVAVPLATATTTYTGTTHAFATLVVPSSTGGSNSATEGYHLRWQQLAVVVAGVIVGLLVDLRV